MLHATPGCRVMGPSGSEDHRTEPSRTRRLWDAAERRQACGSRAEAGADPAGGRRGTGEEDIARAMG